MTNTAEVDMAMALYQRLSKACSNYDLQGKVGVITPYKSQLRLLKDRFSTRFGRDVFDIRKVCCCDVGLPVRGSMLEQRWKRSCHAKAVKNSYSELL